MKTSTKYIALCTAAALLGTACTNLDLNPLDNPSAETWYDDGPKIEMSLNTLLLQQFWPRNATSSPDRESWTWTRSPTT